MSGWICPMDHSLPTPALEGLDSGIPHWLAASFSELCCGLRLFLPNLSIFPFFPRRQTCLFLLSLPTPFSLLLYSSQREKVGCDGNYNGLASEDPRWALPLPFSGPMAFNSFSSSRKCVNPTLSTWKHGWENIWESKSLSFEILPMFGTTYGSLHLLLSLVTSTAFHWEIKVLIWEEIEDYSM